MNSMSLPAAVRVVVLFCGLGLNFLMGGCTSTVEQNGSEAVGEVAEEAVPQVTEKAPKKKSNYAFEIAGPDRLVPFIRQQTYLGRWQQRDDYNADQFPGLVARLKSEVRLILQSQGYFNGTSQTKEIDGGIRLIIDAGARTTVNKVDFILNGPDEGVTKMREFALARWQLPEGSFFDSAVWQSSKRRLIETLNQQGYLRARIVKSQAVISRPLTAASISLEIDSGPRIGFGETQIIGLERYKPEIIRNLQTFKKGDPYTLDALVTFQNRLRGAGYFSDVSVVPRFDQLDQNPLADTVDLTVTVSELNSKRLAFGLGYSTDEGVRGQIGLERRNVFGSSWQMESALVASQKTQRGFANIRSPLNQSNYFWGLGGRLEREDVEGQITIRSNTYLGRGRRLGDIEWFTSLQYQVERQRLVPSDRQTSQHALVLGYSWNLRRLNSPINPSNGFSISAQLSGARKGLATDETFVRFYTRAMRFFPLPSDSWLRNGTIIALGELGIVDTTEPGQIPTENLFRTGGARTVRGYRYLSLGVDQAGSVIGGRYLAVGSLEYQHRMSELYSLAAFVDYGNAADSAANLDPKLGYGMGVRFRTPVGPINLDLAYGQALHRWRAHFSVGYSF